MIQAHPHTYLALKSFFLLKQFEMNFWQLQLKVLTNGKSLIQRAEAISYPQGVYKVVMEIDTGIENYHVGLEVCMQKGHSKISEVFTEELIPEPESES